jgi:hypothetical protein
MFISHSGGKESGIITRQSRSRCEWGEKMAACLALGRKLFDHILMRKVLEAGQLFVSFHFLISLSSFYYTALLSNFAFT